jgi:hypothetical protein
LPLKNHSLSGRDLLFGDFGADSINAQDRFLAFWLLKESQSQKIPAACNVRRGFSLCVLGQPTLARSKTINRKDIEHVSVRLSAA